MDHEGYNPAEMPRSEATHAHPRGAGSDMLLAEPEKLQHAGRRARDGETVYVCISIIKPDQREEFARFVREVEAPAVQALRPRAHASVRLLEPAGPNADGSWSFVWLMDPVAPDEDYRLGPLFDEYFGHEKGRQHLRHWDDMHVGPQIVYETRQGADDGW